MRNDSETAGKVQSRDGTSLAYWRSGRGPALVLVHGTTSDHTTYDELLPHLAQYREVITYDRRGRGESTDSADYEFECELWDAAAVIGHAAARQGSPVDVFGHSFGAFIAVGAALLSSHVRAVVAYSPGFGSEYPAGTLERIETATAADDLDNALAVMFSEVIGMADDEIDFMRQSPVWQVRVAAAGTVARECRADASFLRDYGDRMSRLSIPLLVVDGATNTPSKRRIAKDLAAAVPTAQLFELDGHGHVAHHLAPAELTTVAQQFFQECE